MDLLFGALLAVVYIISPGPVIIETVRRGMIAGFRGAFLLQIGALVADLAIACLTLYGVTYLMGSASIQFSLSIAGTSFLLTLGACSLRQCWQASLGAGHLSSRDVGMPFPAPNRANLRHFVVGLCLAVMNPYAIFFWMSVEHTILQRTPSYVTHFFLGFFLSGVVVSVVVAKLVCLSTKHITPAIFRLTSFGLGVVLIGMGLSLGYTAVIQP